MNDPGKLELDDTEPDAMERLLARHLDRQSQRIDVRSLEQRIRLTLAAERLPAPVMDDAKKGRRPRWLGWAAWAGGCALSACLVLIVVMFWHSEQPVAAASPQALLQQTQQTFLQPVYRCYLIEVQRETDLTDESNPMVGPARQSRLWTRGDRFWIETTFPNQPSRRSYWGRNERGTFWIVNGSKEGVLLQPAETPRWLTVYSDLCSMQPDRLIIEVLRDFDLRREDAPAGSSMHIIKAELKPGRWHPALKSAVLELDAETKVLRRVALRRVINDTTLTTTYTLVETKPQDEIQYPLDGQEGKREFYSSEYKPEERRRLLATLFGQRAAEWIKLMKK
jgi:hypothetical protein